jgi:hypothetical protein
MSTAFVDQDKQMANRLNLSPLERSKIEKHYGGATTLAFISNKQNELAQRHCRRRLSLSQRFASAALVGQTL